MLTLDFNAEQATLLNGSSITMENITIVHTSNGAKEVTAPQPWLVDYIPNDEPTSINNTTNNRDCSLKVLRDGQIFIQRGDKVYTITGQVVN